jgi:predicted dehydrogenase
MDAILDVAKKHNIPVIEDCAQAHFAEYKHRLVGTIGDIGCFSFQQTKQIITGDGGMTITNNSEYGNRGTLFVDKGWNRSAWGGARQYTMLGMNYRMTELQAAVGIAQLRKLQNITERRNRNGTLLTELLMKVDGITSQYVGENDKHTYLYVGFTVNPDAPFTADALARTLSNQGVSASAHNIGKPIFLCSEPLMEKKFYGNSHFPFDHPNARQDITYEPGMCPVAEDVLNRLVLLNVTERYSEKDVKNVANEVSQAVSKLSGDKSISGWQPSQISKGAIDETKAASTPSQNRNSSGSQPSNKSAYKVGIIGCGEISRYHAEAYQANSDVAITAIADINPDALKTIASEFSISNCYADYHEMFEKEQLDIVSICTWPGLHAEMTVATAEHGVKAIFCEKPMAVNLGEADKMINACQKNGVVLVISHQLRFNPHIHKAKQLVESGVIGEPHLVWGHYETSLLNKGTHVVDAMRYILGDPKTAWILAQIERKKDSYNRGHRVEEIAEALIQFSNGTRGLLETGDLAISEFGCHVYGSEGQLDVAFNRLLFQGKEHKGWQQIQLPSVKEHGPAIAELIACLNGELEQHRNNAHQARMTMEILMAIFESVRTHGVVRPPVTTNESPLDLMVESGIL